MSQHSDEGVDVRLHAHHVRKYLKASQYTLIIPVPTDIAALIGLIAIQWGGFEQRMDGVIEQITGCLLRIAPDNWKRLPFKKRKEMFKDITVEYTKRKFISETATFINIADSAGDLHWRRNIVVHGYIDIRSKNQTQTPAFFARGTHKGRDVEISLDVETLEKLRHDIGHLGGNMMAAVFRMGGDIANGSPELVIADKELLQDAQQGSFDFLPTPNTLRRQP